MRRRDFILPPLEDKYPVPAPPTKKRRPGPGAPPSPWVEHLKSAKSGQSVTVPYYRSQCVMIHAKRLGLEMRTQDAGTGIDVNGYPKGKVARMRRIWFIKPKSKKKQP